MKEYVFDQRDIADIYLEAQVKVYARNEAEALEKAKELFGENYIYTPIK